jgi:uncharacterized glyoxalase superfamily protein PhnB
MILTTDFETSSEMLHFYANCFGGNLQRISLDAFSKDGSGETLVFRADFLPKGFMSIGRTTTDSQFELSLEVDSDANLDAILAKLQDGGKVDLEMSSPDRQVKIRDKFGKVWIIQLDE